jgi:hypothetical protein
LINIASHVLLLVVCCHSPHLLHLLVALLARSLGLGSVGWKKCWCSSLSQNVTDVNLSFSTAIFWFSCSRYVDLWMYLVIEKCSVTLTNVSLNLTSSSCLDECDHWLLLQNIWWQIILCLNKYIIINAMKKQSIFKYSLIKQPLSLWHYMFHHFFLIVLGVN